VRNGGAILQDVEIENGTIEFDLVTTGQRSFVGVAFRIQEEGTYENFYLRPHNSGRFDALQYTPVFHDNAAWQLYSEYNGNLQIPEGRWVHVRLDISGSRLEARVDGAGEPTLVVERMRGMRGGGKLALLAYFPEAEKNAGYPTAYADFVVRPSDTGGSYLDDEPPAVESGYVRYWLVSQAQPATDDLPTELPATALESSRWARVPSDAEGRVNLAHHAGIPEGARRGRVMARVILRSQRKQVKKLNFGFSDRASVFLNTRILLTGDNNYRSRSQRYLGVMTIDNDALFLSLDKGDNELVFVVDEAFGGWGVTARLADLEGVVILEPQ